jgi:hypothetical protein
MAISDVYTARSGIVTVATTAATPLMSLISPATKRAWVVGVRIDVQATTAIVGSSVLFQLARPGNTHTATGLATVPAHDFSAPNSISSQALTWSTAPTIGTVLWEQELPQTSGSSWEEFPPAGYEWQVPAIATAAANSGLHLFVTATAATSTTYVADLVFSE